MRKRLLAPFVLSALFFAACGGSSNSNSGDQQANTSAGSQEGGAVDSSMIKPSANAEPRGKQLMAQLDCKTCHKEDVKLIGPSFKEKAA